MKLTQTLLVIVISVVCATTIAALYIKFIGPRQVIVSSVEQPVLIFAKKSNQLEQATPIAADLTNAASLVVPSVVHIKTKAPSRTTNGNDNANNRFRDFGSGFNSAVRSGSGSGAIISSDGYILTANQVITDRRGNPAEEITVTLNNRKTHTATLIGRNAANDIAVLKIDGKDLPHVVFANGDDIHTGQWVLAVGYPLTLEATITAGIISATGNNMGYTNRRTMNIVNANRSFIQTDAAVNRGNNGGPLVNTIGELIGINSGIVSPTGSYAGYSFAIPVDTVKKAVKEIIQASGLKK
jgi:S1-C subfamily serine protease